MGHSVKKSVYDSYEFMILCQRVEKTLEAQPSLSVEAFKSYSCAAEDTTIGKDALTCAHEKSSPCRPLQPRMFKNKHISSMKMCFDADSPHL